MLEDVPEGCGAQEAIGFVIRQELVPLLPTNAGFAASNEEFDRQRALQRPAS